MTHLNKSFAPVTGRWPVAFLMAAALVLTGCGGSSSSDDSPDKSPSKPLSPVSQTPLKIQGQDDAESSALAARKTAKQAIVDDRTPLPGATPGGIEILPAAAQGDIQGPCGGTANVTPLGDNDDDGFRSTFNNYCVTNENGPDTIVDGYLESGGADGTNFFINADYTVKTGSETYTVRKSCTSNGCFNLLDSDGKSYRTYSAAVDGPDTNGAYDAEARVCTDNEGCITYEATGLIECAAPKAGFSGGAISITDSTGTAVVTVDFSGCSSYTVSYGGSSYTVTY